MLNRLYSWYGKRVVIGVLSVLVLLVVVALYFVLSGSDENQSETAEILPMVTLQSVSSFSSSGGFSVVGTVRAISEATLQAEAGGRITSVNVKIGDRVSAGTVLASIDNARERAQLLQAEAAYESALASSLQSGSSLDEAKVGVRNTYKDTFSTVENVVRNLIDEFYSRPTETVVYFKLGGTGKAPEFNSKREDIEIKLDNWSEDILDNSIQISESEMLAYAELVVTDVGNLTAAFALALTDKKSTEQFSESEVEEYQSRLAGARASLDGALASISGARLRYDQAVLSSSSDTVSQSSALLKGALGTLRGAQVTYEKTLVRTPIGGVVNALYVTTGEYINPGQPAAIVANNGALEVSTALGEKDLARVHIGDTVFINNSATGTISQIAPAIDPLTGKSEVKISVDESLTLKNGSTVSVVFAPTKEATGDATIVVPLKALKLLASVSVAFGVSDDGTLVAYPVTLGSITGDSVLITDGLTSDSRIITDARGLKEGDKVSVTQN